MPPCKSALTIHIIQLKKFVSGPNHNLVLRCSQVRRTMTGQSRTWSVPKIKRNIGGQPSRSKILLGTSLLSVNRHVFCLHSSYIWKRIKLMSVMPRLEPKLHWLSWRTSSAILGIGLSTRTHATILTATISSFMSLNSRHLILSSLFLFRDTIFWHNSDVSEFLKEAWSCGK